MTVINEVELVRIESIHRGMLFQHLYGVGCLFLAPANNISAVRVELDEDIEVQHSAETVYVQVKTRGEPLTPSDLETTFARFRQIAELHQNGSRSGSAALYIVSNQPPGPSVEALRRTANWKLLWPGGPEPLPPFLPPPWQDVAEGLAWCREEAARVPFRTVTAEALVWKLAAQVQASAAGEESGAGIPHAFPTSELPRLFEILAVQLHGFPVVPSPLRRFKVEPAIDDATRVHLLTGLSGSGKSSWAAQLALHEQRLVAYVDAALVPDAFPQALFRELVAALGAGLGDELPPALTAGASGLEGLRALSLALHRKNLEPLVVIDNVHCLSAPRLKQACDCLPSVWWLLLSHPSTDIAALEGLFGVRAAPMSGLAFDEIAAELDAACAACGPQETLAVEELTGGLPLYVKNIALIAGRDYGGDTGQLCEEMASRAAAADTMQDALLRRVVDGAGALAHEVLAVMSQLDAALERPLLVSIVGEGFGRNSAEVAAGMRALGRCGALQLSQGDTVELHASFRGVARDAAIAASPPGLRAVKVALVRELEGRVRIGRHPQLLFNLLQLLPEVGRTADFASIVSDHAEMLREVGLSSRIRAYVRRLILADALLGSDRFWLLDGLAFLLLSEQRYESAAPIVSEMTELVATLDDPRAIGACSHKRMLLVCSGSDAEEMERAYADAVESAPDNAWLRVVRYNYAWALYRIGEHAKAEREAAALVQSYLKITGLTRADLFAKNPPEIAAMCTDLHADIDDVKRLADSLDLYAMSRKSQDRSAILERVNSNKLYAVCQAALSVVRTGQDVVDEFLDILADPIGALEFVDNVLIPSLTKFRLVDLVFPVRSQRAVVLAYCGRIREAREELSRLSVFAGSVAADLAADYERQGRLVEEIAQGRRRLAPRINIEDPIRLLLQPNATGRNDPCPCGSGLKYKRCHG